jgi:uncharacterized protein YPO0396
MKRLTRIHLVNWYLFGIESIPVEGTLLVVGPNGAGKSSLLDAVQVALLGGSKGHAQLNANAAQHSRRRIRDYCLGVVRESEDGDGNRRPMMARPESETLSHIILEFTDEATAGTVNVGVCLSVTRSQSDHDVDGAFVWEGRLLELEQLTRRQDGEVFPRPWRALHEDLKRAEYHGEGTLYAFGNERKRYIRQLCRSLGPAHRLLNPDKFVKTVRKMVKLSDIDNVSDFVRDFILDDEPVDIARLEESVKVYQEMVRMARRTRQRIESLGTVQAHYRRTFNAKRNAEANHWAAKELRIQALDWRNEELTAQTEADEQRRSNNAARITAANAEAEYHDAQARQLREEMAASCQGSFRFPHFRSLKTPHLLGFRGWFLGPDETGFQLFLESV